MTAKLDGNKTKKQGAESVCNMHRLCQEWKKKGIFSLYLLGYSREMGIITGGGGCLQREVVGG